MRRGGLSQEVFARAVSTTGVGSSVCEGLIVMRALVGNRWSFSKELVDERVDGEPKSFSVHTLIAGLLYLMNESFERIVASG